MPVPRAAGAGGFFAADESPSVMVFFSLALRPVASRWTNIVLGIIYTIVIIATLPGTWAFYVFLGVVEAALTIAIVWHAWRWPAARSAGLP